MERKEADEFFICLGALVSCQKGDAGAGIDSLRLTFIESQRWAIGFLSKKIDFHG